MDDQSSAQQNSQYPDCGSSSRKRVEPSQADAGKPATAQQLADVEQQMTSFEKATLRWSRTAVILSFLAAVFVSAQWWEMHQGGKDTHDLASAAVASNRAWLVPTGAVKTDSPDFITLYWKNAGRTPAVDLIVRAEYTTDSPEITINWGCDHLVNALGWSTQSPLLLPNDPFEFRLMQVPDEWKSAPLNSSHNVLEAHGCIWYTDVLTNTRRTIEFCYTAMKMIRPGETAQKVGIAPCMGKPGPFIFH